MHQLLQISNKHRGAAALSHLSVGMEVDVACLAVDPLSGSIKLSRKALLDDQDRKFFHTRTFALNENQ